MGKGLLIGGSVVVAGVFVGFVAYKIVKKKCPNAIEDIRKKASDIGKKMSAIAAEAKRAFAEGFESAQAKVATA